MAAFVPLRNDTAGRAYYWRKLGVGAVPVLTRGVFSDIGSAPATARRSSGSPGPSSRQHADPYREVILREDQGAVDDQHGVLAEPFADWSASDARDGRWYGHQPTSKPEQRGELPPRQVRH